MPSNDATTRSDLGKKGYASTTKEGFWGAKVELFLKHVETQTEFEAENGATVPLKGGGSVDIPPGVLVDEKGQPASGKVQLQVASVAGSKREQSAALPEYNGINREGERGKGGRALLVARLRAVLRSSPVCGCVS